MKFYNNKINLLKQTKTIIPFSKKGYGKEQ